jgi:hypothetical protein
VQNKDDNDMTPPIAFKSSADGRFFIWFTRLALLLTLLTVGACSAPGVRPWQRDLLAKPEMQFNADGVTQTFDRHFYFSKEGSSGGQGFAGGGCGCN